MRGRSLLFFAAAACWLAFGEAAFAQPSQTTPDGETVRNLVDLFRSVFTSRLDFISGRAKVLGQGLIVVQILVSTIWIVAYQDDARKEGANMVKRILVMLLMFGASQWAFIPNSPFSPLVVQGGWEELAEDMNGGRALDPGLIVQQGHALSAKLLTGLAHMSLLDRTTSTPMVFFLSFTVMLSFYLLAAFVLVTLVQGMFAILTSPLFLACGCSQFSAPYSEGFIGWSMEIGIRTFALGVMAVFGAEMVREWQMQLDAALDGGAADVLWLAPQCAAFAIVYVIVVIAVPSGMAKRITQSSHLGIKEALVGK